MALCTAEAIEPIQAYFIAGNETLRQAAMLQAEKIRDQLPHFKLMVDCGTGGFKNQFKRADKSGARLALIIGEDEFKSDTITVKYLREELPQETIAQNALTQFLEKI